MSEKKLARFLNDLDRDSSFRKRELYSHKSLLESADAHQKSVLCRSGVLLIYSHWEGFVRHSVQCYLDLFLGGNVNSMPIHVRTAALYRALKRNQADLTLKFAKISNDFFLDDDSIVDKSISEIVQTVSTLKYNRLEELWHLIDTDDSPLNDFATSRNFIDAVLVDKRNGIAHGECQPVSVETYELLHTKTLELIELFKEKIIQSAKQYHSAIAG